MQAKILKLLEFDKIVGQLVDCAATMPGKQLAGITEPATVVADVEHRLLLTDEACKVARIKGEAPFGGISDTRSAMKRSVIGGMLAPAELVAVATNIDAARRLRRFLIDFHEEHDCPRLVVPVESLCGGATSAPRLAGAGKGAHAILSEAIRACIDEQGQILDQASPELTRIRQEIRSAEARVREKLEQMMRSSTVQKMLQELLVTIRNERFVLPVKAEYRSSMNGIIHDQSASGATLFIEPEAVVQLNNKLKEFRLREEQEIEKILFRLSGQVAELAVELEGDLEVMAQLDVIFARAKLAGRHKASLPLMNVEGRIRMRKARHPLLDATTVVPLDLQLGGEYRGIIITGPNTGGKTVALKTVGLLSLMAMSGLFVPAEDGSELCVFSGVFADIGDEQSIEQSLSTFSGHMKNMISILNEVSAGSLVLLDEMGAGTDPTEGAALAVALLEHLCETGCVFIATTHYSSLKAYATEREGVINASVEFDGASLRPTYRLLVGIPGRSNAIAIAERLGLPEAILEKARQQLGRDEQRVDRMLDSLEQERKQLEQQRLELTELRSQSERLRTELDVETSKLATERQQKMVQAGKEAAAVVERAREEAEQLLANLRALHVKEHELIEARRQLDDLQHQVTETTASHAAHAKSPSRAGQKMFSPIEVGDEVQVIALGQIGAVLERLNPEELLVQVGAMKMRVKQTDLQKIRSANEIEKQTATTRREVTAVRRANQEQTVKLEIDVRGLNLDEALTAVDQYLSDVLLAGLARVTIIHGVGTGVLRKGIQNHLKNHRHVKSHRLGQYGEGDLGVTVVEMK